MKTFINEDDLIAYVSESDMIKFIEANSDYEWNQLCDLCGKEIFSEEGKVYYDGKIKKENWNTEFAVEWVNNFFDAHPFIKKLMFVFDD